MDRDDAQLQAIVARDARARVAAMVAALHGARPRDVADRIWREAHTLVGLAGTMGDLRLERTTRGLASRLRDEFGRPVPLTDMEEASIVRDVEELRRAVEQVG